MRARSRLAWALLAVLLLGAAPAGAEAPRAGPLVIDLLVDRAANKDFLQESEMQGAPGYVYEFAGVSPDKIVIRLDAPKIMELWKGKAPIADGMDADNTALFFEASQFTPALLVADIKNVSGRKVQVSGAYIDVTRSATDLQPLIALDSGSYVPCGDPGTFHTDITFLNHGWGPVQDATLAYGFGKSAAAPYAAKLGSFDRAKSVSLLEGLKAAGLNAEAIKAGGFKCASYDAVPACVQALKAQGLLGNLPVTPYGSNLLTHVAGTLSYRWTDNAGAAHERQSPVSADISLLRFEMPIAECGGVGAVDRSYQTVKLPLDLASYRIPLAYKGTFGVQEQKRFGLGLVADKSSQHLFRLVLEMADGTTAASPLVDLLYFKPRFDLTN